MHRTAAFAILYGCAMSIVLGACRDAVVVTPVTACRDCNVILISMDTLRADHVGAYGYEKATTPNIDALAERGVLFENAIAQSSWTRPAHMSIFTGLHPAEHGYIALKDRQRLDDTVPTLAKELRRYGYTTAAFAGGVNVSAAFGFDQGFDTYRSNGKYFRDNLEDTKYWLEQNGDKKLFLFLHGYDAHTPYLTDPADRAALALPENPPTKGLRAFCQKVGDRTRARRYIAEYDGAIHRGDRYVGKILRHLEQIGVLDNALIVFLSDHGEEFLEHGRCFHLTTLYREVLHVPLVFAGTGIHPRRVPQMVPASVSIAPTILELVGITDHAIPGPSLAPMVVGREEASRYVLSETMRSTEKGAGEGHLRSVTTPSGKLVHWITQDRTAYFDTRADPEEQAPITEGDRHDELVSFIETWGRVHAPGAAVEHGGDAPIDEGLDRELRALGYLD